MEPLLITYLSDLDDSRSLLGGVEDMVLGFPADGLVALYTFDEFAAGTGIPATVRDASPFAHDAVLQTNSRLVRVGEGARTPNANPSDAGRGFALITPVAFGPEYTALTVVRPLATPSPFYNDANPAHYIWHLNSGAVPADVAASAVNEAAAQSYSIGYSNAGHQDGGLLTGGQRYPCPSSGSFPGVTVSAYSLSAAGTLRQRMGGVAAQVSLPAAAAAATAAGGTHAFGLLSAAMGGAGSYDITGNVGLYALWDRAMDDAQLNDIQACARSFMGLRGVTGIN